MTIGPEIISAFNDAAEYLPETDFANSLKETFGHETARRTLGMLEKMGLPAPEDAAEFIEGTAGPLLFLNRYGLVMRIEHKDTEKVDNPNFWFDRVNDNPYVLRPLVSLDAGAAIIEICPGCHSSNDTMASFELSHQLREQGINYWDEGPHNIGRIPVQSDMFPDGITVVIDRGAVNRLTGSTSSAKRKISLAESREQAAVSSAQERLYGPLCASFVEGWEGRESMRQFWDMCKSHVREGKLVAGWNEAATATDDGFVTKKSRGAEAAAAYESRLRTTDNPAAKGTAFTPL